MLRGMRESRVKLRLCRMLVFMIVSFFSLLVSFYVQGDNACPVCLSIQVSVAHAKVGKRFRNHKSVACFFLSLPLPPFPFLSPSPSLFPPLSMSWKREYGYTPPIVKLGRESAYIYPLTIRNNSRFRIHVLSHSCLFYGSKKERERRDAQDIMIKNAGANPSLSVCAPDRTRTYTSQDTRS